MQDRELERLSNIVNRITKDSHNEYQNWLARAVRSDDDTDNECLSPSTDASGDVSFGASTEIADPNRNR
jgi:hypothetical protein